MSAEELSRLSLRDTMVTTRAGAARARTAPAQASATASTSTSTSSSEASSPTTSLIEAASERLYDISAYDEQLRRRAAIGLRADDNAIKVKYCRELLGDPTRYMFYVYDDISISMGGDHDIPQCSCGANEEGRACKHIFWILDQLASGVPESIRSQTLHIAKDGSELQGIRPTDIVERLTLAGIAENMEWPLQESADLELTDIEDEIADVLSPFEPSDALPSELKSPGSPYLSERSQKFWEFKELLSQYAAEDRGLLIRLQGVIDASFQAQVFFEKIDARIDQAFEALTQYIAKGPTPGKTKKYDVVNCATELRALVDFVSSYYAQQEQNNPDRAKVATWTGTALVKILEEVTTRDVDIYAEIEWGAIPPENPAERNLFVYLIGTPPADERLFVLDALRDLPHDDVLRNHWDDLKSIGFRLEQHSTPLEYMNAFDSIITETRKRAASEARGSSAKRPMQ